MISLLFAIAYEISGFTKVTILKQNKVRKGKGFKSLQTLKPKIIIGECCSHSLTVFSL
jgi:hypothetical protein